MKTSRLLEMEKYILSSQSVDMDTLCKVFDVSMNTVRRDVADLLKRGTVEKVYGGVCAKKSGEQTLTPFDVRKIAHEDAKIKIGSLAATLVNQGDIIFIDSGTTTLHMVNSLRDKQDLTVVTNNLEAINLLLPLNNVTVISLPGVLRRKTNSFTGTETARALRSYNIRLAFMASTGVTHDGVTNSSIQEFDVKRAALEGCVHAILLLSANKFGEAGLMTYARLSDFEAVITDKLPPKEYLDALKAGDTRLICP